MRESIQSKIKKKELLKFITEKGKIRNSRDEIRFMSVDKKNVENLKKALNKHNINSKVFGPWKNNTGSLYYCLIIKNVKEVMNGKKF